MIAFKIKRRAFHAIPHIMADLSPSPPFLRHLDPLPHEAPLEKRFIAEIDTRFGFSRRIRWFRVTGAAAVAGRDRATLLHAETWMR